MDSNSSTLMIYSELNEPKLVRMFEPALHEINTSVDIYPMYKHLRFNLIKMWNEV